MGAVFDAIGVFFEQLTSVEFGAAPARGRLSPAEDPVHEPRVAERDRGGLPRGEVPWRTIYGAYVSAVGVNAVLPARGGDAVRLYLAHRAVPGATYTTLARRCSSCRSSTVGGRADVRSTR